MTIFDAIIQGILHGLTEFLPVSSSGHLSLYQYFTGTGSEEGALFSLVLHLGTLVAVIIAFWGTIWRLVCAFFGMIGEIFTGRFNIYQPKTEQRMILLLIVSLLPLFLTLFFKDILRGVAQDNDIVVEGVCFLITGTILYLAVKVLPGRKKAREMSYRSALAIGLAQAIAPLPGISRSGATLGTGMLLGLDKKFAVEFSFIMGIPAVCAALLLDAREILSSGFALEPIVLGTGLLVSLIFGLLAIGMVRWLVASNHLIWFSYYTLILGTVIIIIGLYEQLMGHPFQHAISAWIR